MGLSHGWLVFSAGGRSARTLRARDESTGHSASRFVDGKRTPRGALETNNSVRDELPRRFHAARSCSCAVACCRSFLSRARDSSRPLVPRFITLEENSQCRAAVGLSECARVGLGQMIYLRPGLRSRGRTTIAPHVGDFAAINHDLDHDRNYRFRGIIIAGPIVSAPWQLPLLVGMVKGKGVGASSVFPHSLSIIIDARSFSR